MTRISATEDSRVAFEKAWAALPAGAHLGDVYPDFQMAWDWWGWQAALSAAPLAAAPAVLTEEERDLISLARDRAHCNPRGICAALLNIIDRLSTKGDAPMGEKK
jgi:hypothetical protein